MIFTRERREAKLILQDGKTFNGYSFGAGIPASGEVVFNTGMIGYPETLTDPSYRGQILVMTFPLIGNYGVPEYKAEDGIASSFESDKVQISGLVVTEHSARYSHWSAKKSLAEWLSENGVPGIWGVDTRAVTKHLRESGTTPGKIVFGDDCAIGFDNPNERNLASEVSIKEIVEYKAGKKLIIIVDCGVKNNIIRAFIRRGISVKRVPWDFDFSHEDVDGVVLSNGPGNPKQLGATIENTKKWLKTGRPILGICLGSQILALSAGADTYKLKYGHRSQNQPCVEAGTKRCYITSQNHGYAVDVDTLPEDWREWFYNNNDRTNEGLRHISKPFFGAQFHPEASPGPDDTEYIFDMFVRALR